MEVFLGDSWTSEFVALICYYLQLEAEGTVQVIRLSQGALKMIDKNLLKLPAIPCLIAKEGSSVNTPLFIAHYLATERGIMKFLFGKPEEELNVRTFL